MRPAAKKLDKEDSSEYGIVCSICKNAFQKFCFVTVAKEKKVFQKALFFSAALLVIILLPGTAGIGRAADTGPENIELKSPRGKRTARFTHWKHQELYQCRECHHGSKEGMRTPYRKNMNVRKCVACHNKNEMENPRFNSFKLAAHGLCKECHKKMKKTAPTKCSGCHIK
jgi:hypothetical protein